MMHIIWKFTSVSKSTPFLARRGFFISHVLPCFMESGSADVAFTAHKKLFLFNLNCRIVGCLPHYSRLHIWLWLDRKSLLRDFISFILFHFQSTTLIKHIKIYRKSFSSMTKTHTDVSHTFSQRFHRIIL